MSSILLWALAAIAAVSALLGWSSDDQLSLDMRVVARLAAVCWLFIALMRWLLGP